jgi:hypothetical protein
MATPGRNEDDMSNDVKRVWVFIAGAKLLRTVALTAAVMAFGSLPSEAASFNYLGPENSSHVFTFGEGADYSFELTFSGLAADADFTVTVTDIITTQAALLDSSRLNNFPGATCVPIADGISDCVEFEVDAPAKGPTTYSFFDITVRWLADTNELFSNEPGNRIRLLHNRGDVEGNGFDTDITFGSYDPDPAIGGRDDNFQSFLVVQAVPEPATMLLLGSGLIGAIQRRRRQLKPLSSSARTPRA